METAYSDRYRNYSTQFKSYYVVWKQNINTSGWKFRRGLNRTMQYGNLELFDLHEKGKIGLNRTMQYGNLMKKR